MSDSEEVESNEIDCDADTTVKLSQLFDESLRVVSEEAVSLKKKYLLYLDSSNPLTTEYKQPIVGIRFANENPNTISMAQASGNIYLYDIRSNPSHVQMFHDDDMAGNIFSCFDMNSDDTILCAGTEKANSESHLVLFDVRKSSILTTYDDSHSEDVTQVKFHPSKANVMASGSTDGLINVFDVSKDDDNDTLEYCLNTESSVQKISWHSKSDMEVNDGAPKDYLSCITDVNDFHLYDVEDSELVFQVKREQITEHMKRKSGNECYLVNCHNAANGDIFLLAGSNYNRGECLRSLTVHDKSLKPRNNFTENKQIVRCSLFNAKNNVLITAGEGGIITVWENFQASTSDSHQLKEKIKKKESRKSKPY